MSLPLSGSVATLRADKHEIACPRFETFPGKFARARGRRTRGEPVALCVPAVVLVSRDCVGQNRYPGGSAARLSGMSLNAQPAAESSLVYYALLNLIFDQELELIFLSEASPPLDVSIS